MARALSGLALVVAVVTRLAFLDAKPFWRDEAWVAWLAERPWTEVFASAWAVPRGFLVAVKGVAVLLPGLPPELALRVIPLGAGLATIALLPRLARALGASATVGVVAMGVACGLPAFVHYSRELKSWPLDLLLAVLLPLFALEARTSRRAALGLVFALLLTPWLSFGGLFPAAAVLALLALDAWRGQGSRMCFWIAALALALALGATLWLVLARQASSPFLREVWRAEMEGGAGAPSRIATALFQVHRVSLPYFFPAVWPVALALALIGAFTWPREGRGTLLWLWLATGALTGIAAALGLYVLAHGRFVLFLAPPLLLLASGGLLALLERAVGRGRGGAAAMLLAAAVGIAWSAQAVAHRLRPVRHDPARFFLFDVVEDVEPLISWLERERVPARNVMVSRYAEYPFRYYSRGRLQGAAVCGLLACRDFGQALDRWLARTRGERFLLLVDEEAQRGGGKRRALVERGLEIEEAASARGAQLWRIRPREASPPRTR